MATRSSTMIGSTVTKSASGGNLKEKRGTAPSNSHIHRKPITRSASDAKEKSSSSSSAAEKHIPNYLKPTVSLSTRNDQALKPNNVKQSSNGTTMENQKLVRRRSFDKPPSSSPRFQKALISPPARPRDNRTAPLRPKERAGTIRSSSFLGRSNSTTSSVSSRSVLDRSATSLSSKLSLDSRSSFAPRTPKAVKPQPVFTSRTTKKSAKAKDFNASPSSSSSSKTLNPEAKQEEEEKECQNREVFEDKVEGDVVEVHDQNDVIPKLENNEEDHDHENEKVVEDKTCEVSTVLEDDNVVNQAAHLEEETEEKSHEEERSEENSKEIDVVAVEGNDHDDGHDHQHEEITQAGEEKGDETSDDHKTGDENKVEEKAVEGGEEQGESEEAAKQEVGNGNSAASTSTPHKLSGGQLKNESPTAYNDVIEETASKLLEKRKNKVKALVGAFETVIDYESGACK